MPLSIFKLNNASGEQSVEVPADRALVVGRAVTSDLPVYDPTVSRKHAEVSVVGPDGLVVRDLGSSNGTFVNGQRIDQANVSDGDVVTFGKVPFHVKKVTPRAAATGPANVAPQASVPEATIVRQMPVKDSVSLEQQVVSAAKASGNPETKLRLLLDISKELAKQGDVDKLLSRIADLTFQVMDVDRVSILMVENETEGGLIPRISKNRLGDGSTSRYVPRSIANRCVEERLAILTDNAAADDRFQGQSILMQSVRSAMCTPLMDTEGRVLGLLYVDNLTATNSFGDDDLEFLIAFSGIAAVALENSQLTGKLAREAVVLSNFQRYFAPDLIDQISGQDDVVQLGGAKRTVVIFFSDIRGFTSMSSEMNPNEIATLLNEYFTVMVDIVFEHGGTLDKFMGDAIMALWGAPLTAPDDADRAMRAAFEMMEALDLLNLKWQAESRPLLQIGIGIDYGEVFAGNIGSDRRLEYTVIGDTVNVASRLCSKAAGHEILISHSLFEALQAKPQAERLGLEVKGKVGEVTAYRVNR